MNAYLFLFQKAFDTVAHSVLLMKLEASGLGNDITRWFESYLCDRQQLVWIILVPIQNLPVSLVGYPKDLS